MIPIIVFLGMLIAALLSPLVGLVLVSQIHLFRALEGAQSSIECIGSECMIRESAAFGLILPIIIMTIAFGYLLRKNSFKNYYIQLSDIIFVFTILAMIFSIAYAQKSDLAIDYTLRFIILGASYYFFWQMLSFMSWRLEKGVRSSSTNLIFFSRFYWIMCRSFPNLIWF
jgi:hypothetical protein